MTSARLPFTEPVAIVFEIEIAEEQMRPRCQRRSISLLPQENGWQNSFTVRHEDYEDVADQNMWKYSDPEAKELLFMWNQQYNFKAAERLGRTLVFPPLPDLRENLLQMNW